MEALLQKSEGRRREGEHEGTDTRKQVAERERGERREKRERGEKGRERNGQRCGGDWRWCWRAGIIDSVAKVGIPLQIDREERKNGRKNAKQGDESGWWL